MNCERAKGSGNQRWAGFSSNEVDCWQREREREIDVVDCSVTSLCERLYRRARLTINLDALNGFLLISLLWKYKKDKC